MAIFHVPLLRPSACMLRVLWAFLPPMVPILAINSIPRSLEYKSPYETPLYVADRPYIRRLSSRPRRRTRLPSV